MKSVLRPDRWCACEGKAVRQMQGGAFPFMQSALVVSLGI